MSQKEPSETAPRIVVYTVAVVAGPAGRAGSSSAVGAASFIAPLKLLFPSSQFSVGSDSTKLVVYARPADHERIRTAIAEMSKREAPETAPRVVVYTVESVTATAAVTALKAMFPDAQFSAGTDPNKVIAFARPADHEVIKTAVEQISKKDPPETARKVVVYTIQATGAGSAKGAATRQGGAAAAMTSLKTMFPDAQFSVGADPSRLIVWARPGDHIQIAKAVEEIARQESPETAPRAAVYQLSSMTPEAAILLLKSAFPDAQVAAGTDPGKLVVWARPADQKVIQGALEAIESGGLPGATRMLMIYPMKRDDVTALTQMLDPVFKKSVVLVPDTTRNRVLVWSDARQQPAVKTMIEQYIKDVSNAPEPVSQVYHLRVADPKAVSTALTALVPSAKVATDLVARSVVISAMPEDHVKIKTTVDEMDRVGANSQAPMLQVHKVQSADPTSLLKVLTALYKGRTDVQVSVDDKNANIVAVAPPAQQEMIQSLVEQADKGALADTGVKLEMFSLKDVDSTSAMTLLNTLFQKQGTKVQLSVEARTNQLVAIARPDQLDLIRNTVQQLRGGEQTMEIIQLEAIDATVAQMAIDRMFAENGLLRGPRAPQIDVDTVGQQLFVQATKEQHPLIRDMLIKLGETGLAESQEGTTRFSRVIPFTGNQAGAIEELKRLWPKIRPNPLEVMPAKTIELPVPSTPVSTPGAKHEQKHEPKHKAKGAPTPTPSPDPTPASPTTDAKPADAPAVTPAAETENSAAAAMPPTVTSGAGVEEPGIPGAPIVITPGDGNIKITSDDPAALDQFENLLRAIGQRSGSAGHNLTVYTLQNARASAVATTLQSLYRATPAGRRAGTAANTLTVIPDERLNSLIVHANRADKSTIDNLVRMLDAGEVPEALSANRMRLIAVKNTPAANVLTILQSVYKNQVDSFGVEENTNSIVVTAAPAMTEEISRFVQTIDEAAGSDPSRKLKLIPLQRNNSQRIQQALNLILHTTTTGRTGSTSRTPTSSVTRSTINPAITTSSTSKTGTGSSINTPITQPK